MKAMKSSMIILTAFLAMMTITPSIFSHTAEEQKSVEELVQEIFQKQNVTSVKQIDCNKVSDVDFENFGDAVMGRMIGNDQLHQQMDNMMGGEGSQSLTQMHISMGKNWLGCGSGFNGMMGGGMMGGGMMPMMMRMMGNYYPGYYSNYDTVLTFGIIGWVLFAVLLVILALLWNGQIKFKKTK